MHLGAGAHQRPLRGVHDVRPVRAALAGQQPPEEGQGVGGAETVDPAVEGPPDDEVGALARTDLVLDDPLDDPRVLVVAHVEVPVLDPYLVRGQGGQGLGERQFVGLAGEQHRQRRPVVAHVEAPLADLPERHQRERVVYGAVRAGRAGGQRDVGQPLGLDDRSEEEFDGVVRAAGGAPVQQGERRTVVVEQPFQEGGGVAMHTGFLLS